MNIRENHILITGGGSGIGRGLAEAFHKLGNQVLIAGRRQSVLDETVAANPGLKAELLDIDDAGSIAQFSAKVNATYPGIDTVIHCAGIMRPEDLLAGDVSQLEALISTNLLGPIRLNAALLPLLRSKAKATIMTVSSGLAFMPLALTPTYCATKAAVHSYTQSLRFQLKDTAIQVLELIPPYVQTELMGSHQANDPEAMPLVEFIAETMQILSESPNATEICVKRVECLRFAERDGTYENMFKQFNEARLAASR